MPILTPPPFLCTTFPSLRPILSTSPNSMASACALRICGSSHGWLVLEKKTEVWLLNPITRDHISLPSLSAQPEFLKGSNAEAIGPGRLISLPTHGIRKAILSSNPSSDPDFLTMVLSWDPWEIAFCRVGDNCWTVLSVVKEDVAPSLWCVADIVYHKQLFYVIFSFGEVWKWDIRKRICKFIHSSNDHQGEIDFVCIVEGTCDEHGLMIYCNNWDHVILDEITMSDILIFSDEQEIWLNMEEKYASNYCFFLNGDIHCISLPLANLQQHGWDGNCICYISEEFERMDGANRYGCSIKLYKSDDRSVTTLASRLSLMQPPKSYPSNDKRFLWLSPTLC